MWMDVDRMDKVDRLMKKVINIKIKEGVNSCAGCDFYDKNPESGEGREHDENGNLIGYEVDFCPRGLKECIFPLVLGEELLELLGEEKEVKK
jgi:hypothetical protein